MRSIFSLFIACAAVSASPLKSRGLAPITLNVVGGKFDKSSAGKTFAQHERDKFAAVSKGSQPIRRGSSQNGNVVINDQVFEFTVNISIGDPATQCRLNNIATTIDTLILDTGSANTWVGGVAGRPFVPTSTSVNTSDDVSRIYGSGSGGFFNGHEWIDRVALSPNLVIQQQSIGAADIDNTSDSFDGFDGIIGVAPTVNSVGTLSPDSDEPIPTPVDNLFAQGTIPEALLGLFFRPGAPEGGVTGEASFGFTDTSQITGPISFAPLTTTPPSNNWWGIAQSIDYGTSTILSETTGIVDTGTTLLLLTTSAFDLYQTATGGVQDEATGLLKLTEEQFDNLESLFFNINGVSLELTPDAQLWPRFQNADIGGDADGYYLVVNDLGSPLGPGFDFVMGYAFLQRYYSIYDTGNKQVGFATTAFTDATTNQSLD